MPPGRLMAAPMACQSSRLTNLSPDRSSTHPARWAESARVPSSCHVRQSGISIWSVSARRSIMSRWRTIRFPGIFSRFRKIRANIHPVSASISRCFLASTIFAIFAVPSLGSGSSYSQIWTGILNGASLSLRYSSSSSCGRLCPSST